MRENFEKWMASTEDKVPGVVSRYATAINRISQHYSEETGRSIDIYKINDILFLKDICTEYCRDGRFYDFGNENHGLYRAAICAYVRFFEQTGDNRIEIQNQKFETVTEGKITVKKNSTEDIIINIRLPGILKET